MKYEFNGLKSPLWGGLFNPLFSPFEGSSMAGGGAPAFDPATLFASGEKGFLYDPSNGSTLFTDTAGTTPVTASGQSVQRMEDLSGNGWHVTYPGAGTAPTYIESGGLKLIRFNGSTSRLSCVSVNMASLTKATLVIAVTQNSLTTGQSMFEHGAGGPVSGGIAAYASNGPNGSFGAALGNGSAWTFNAGPAAAVPRTYVGAAVFTPAAAAFDDQVAISVNGAAVDETQVATNGTMSNAAFGTRNLYLGHRSDGTSPFDGDIMFLCLIGRELTTEEFQNLQTYAAERGGGILLPFEVTPSSFDDTGAEDVLANYRETSPFASVTYETAASAIEVVGYTSTQSLFPTMSQLGVYVDGAFHASAAPTADGVITAVVSLPAGSKQVTVVNGLQSRPNSANPPLGSWLTKIRSDQQMTRVTATPTNRLLIYGDSIAVGANSLPPTHYGWPLLVRSARSPDSTAIEAWGYRSLHEDCVDASARSAFVSVVSAYSPSILWIAIGTNDYGLNKWSAASFGTAYAALLDALNSALPDLVIYCQTPIVRANEAANGSGSTLGDYRTQIATAVSTRTAYATLVDGTAILTTGDLADGVHPTTAGHAIYASAVETELGL